MVNSATPVFRIREPSRLLVMLALSFVPGLYLLLVALALLSLGVAAGGCYIMYQIGSTAHSASARLLVPGVLLCIGAVLACVAVVRGVVATIWKRPPFVPGIVLNLSKERDFGYFVAPLCSAVDTRIPDAIILHAEPEAFVAQGKFRTFNGYTRGRVLAIGLPLLVGLRKTELRAILAHEFAHFSGRDTLYSSFVLPVYVGGATAHESMSEDMEATDSCMQQIPMMLPCLCLSLFLRLFHVIDQHISRLREERADMIAVRTCGQQSFKTGLMKTVGLMGAFYDSGAAEIIRQCAAGQGGLNHYTAFRKALSNLNEIANSYYRRALVDQNSIHDSHFCLKHRLDSCPNMPERFTDNEPASTLLSGLEEYEEFFAQRLQEAQALART